MSILYGAAYRRVCFAKSQYETREEAVKGILRYYPNTPMNPYLCPCCRKWHIGHPKAKLKRKEKK